MSYVIEGHCAEESFSWNPYIIGSKTSKNIRNWCEESNF